MADPDHLEVAQYGTDSWDEWREDNPDIRPDLSNAQLDGIDLSYADLSRVDLHGASLRSANLSEARLRYADLNKAVLHRANLNGADLQRVNLRLADLSGANLAYANLALVDFYGADLSRSDLRGAVLVGANLSSSKLLLARFTSTKFGATVLAQVDLSSVMGLESVRHSASSEVGISTYYLSKGRIPEKFLRGCGLPESFITFSQSLVSPAFDY